MTLKVIHLSREYSGNAVVIDRVNRLLIQEQRRCHVSVSNFARQLLSLGCDAFERQTSTPPDGTLVGTNHSTTGGASLKRKRAWMRKARWVKSYRKTTGCTLSEALKAWESMNNE